MNATASTQFPDVTERIAQVIWVLCQTVTMRLSRRALTPEQVNYVVGRLLGIRRRFRGLVERIRAGKPPKQRARTSRPRRATPKPELDIGVPPPPGWRRWAPREHKPVPLWRALRQHVFAWVCGLVPAVLEFPGSAAAGAEDLRMLLAEPEMRALLMSSRSVGDSLRSLCWMLGVDRSLLYPAPSLAAAPVVVSPEPLGATPGEMVLATPPAAAMVTPDENHHFPAAATPWPLALDGVVPSSRASPCPEGDFSAPG